MSSVNIPEKDSKYRAWILRFAKVAAENAVELGLTTEQTETLDALASNFNNAYHTNETAKLAAKASVGAKDKAREVSEKQFRAISRLLNANPDIRVELKGDLGFTLPKTVSGPVVTPTELTVQGSEIGVNRLKWSRNGNSNRTTFLIEMKLPDSSEWTLIDAITATMFDHKGQVPGQQIAYRVSSKRAGLKSVPCPAVVAYLGSKSEPVLSVAAA